MIFKTSLINIVILISLGLVCCKQTTKIDSRKEVTAISKKKKIESFEHELFNKKIIGLSKLGESKDVFKNFEIDFYASCMCEPSSFYIDTNNKKILVLDICSDGISDVKYKFDIENISRKENIVSIKIKNKNLFLKFKKQENIFLYSFFIDGKVPNDYAGFRVYSFFTNEKTSKKFNTVGCGDFDG